MPNPNINDLIRVLQIAISPVVLISGVALLILSMTNRMSHLIDRMRVIHHEILRTSDPAEWDRQLQILLKRVRLIKLGLLMFALCILLDSLVVIALFLLSLTGTGSGWLVALLFSLSLAFMIAGVVIFLVDVSFNLNALELELGRR